MKKFLPIIALSATLASSLSALEIRYGSGEFEMSGGIQNFNDVSVKCDIDVFGVHEQHYLINDKVYLFGNLEIYSSDKVETFANYADGLMNSSLPSLPINLPFDFSTPNAFVGNFIPVPSSYEVEGVDFDIGVGVDVVQEDNYYLGIGVVTGVSTPLMKMENYFQALNFFTDILDYTETEMITYKAGLSLQAGFSPNDAIDIYTTGIYAYQTGEITNSIVDSDMDADGSYTSFEVGLRYTPSSMPNFYLSAGYKYKDWEVDSMKANIMGFETPDLMDTFDIELSSNYSYISVGYKF